MCEVFVDCTRPTEWWVQSPHTPDNLLTCVTHLPNAVTRIYGRVEQIGPTQAGPWITLRRRVRTVPQRHADGSVVSHIYR